ncbi:hypothetical protein [Marinomonas sp. 2405UD68-3]|uniref:hypothetical protein n=1 Tax=Marinomonas sp. 2405UD68-3 TaxID=3391835 RepID=UPI0039C90DC7
MMQKNKYGSTKSNQLRRFHASTICATCATQMVQSKRDKTKFACRVHPEQSRHIDQIIEERQFFEFIHDLLDSQGAKGIMIHEVNDEDPKSRGEYVTFYRTEYLANPCFSWPIALTIILNLHKMGHKYTNFITMITVPDGLFNNSWRLNANGALVNLSTDMLALASSAIDQLKKGKVINGFIFELTDSDDALSYVEAIEMAQSSKLPDRLKGKFQDSASSLKKRLKSV